MRSNGCGEIRNQDITSEVEVCGWVDRCRDHGGVIFIDLRDQSGTVQVTVDPDEGKDLFNIAENLRNETVIQITGLVQLLTLWKKVILAGAGGRIRKLIQLMG